MLNTSRSVAYCVNLQEDLRYHIRVTTTNLRSELGEMNKAAVFVDYSLIRQLALGKGASPPPRNFFFSVRSVTTPNSHPRSQTLYKKKITVFKRTKTFLSKSLFFSAIIKSLNKFPLLWHFQPELTQE